MNDPNVMDNLKGITNMKKLLLGILGVTFLSSCANMGPVGVIYTDVNVPRQATSASGTKVGQSVSKSYLGLIATGDSSIEQAKRNAGISTVSSVDHKVNSVLGIYTKYTTTVTGN